MRTRKWIFRLYPSYFVFKHLPRDMRPLFSMDSFMALGIDTKEVLPPLRIFFFLGFSTSVYRGVERDRCLRWWWWRWLVPPLLAPPTVPLAAPAVVLVRADSLSPVLLHLQKRETHDVCVCADILHSLPARQQFDSCPLAVPVPDWALCSTSSPLRVTATQLRFANVQALALCLNHTTKGDLIIPCHCHSKNSCVLASPCHLWRNILAKTEFSLFIKKSIGSVYLYVVFSFYHDRVKNFSENGQKM